MKDYNQPAVEETTIDLEDVIMASGELNPLEKDEGTGDWNPNW